MPTRAGKTLVAFMLLTETAVVIWLFYAMARFVADWYR